MTTTDTAPYRRAMNDVEKVAEAIAFAHQGKSWDCLPSVAHHQYRRMAQAAIDSLGLTEEMNTYQETETKVVTGGEGAMSYGGQSTRILGWRTDRHLVSPWEQVARSEL
jgi:hypothetical protein